MPFVADFRDPWLELDYYQDIRRIKPAAFIDAKLERKVLSSADAVMTISPSIRKLLLSKQYNEAIHVITNGFDEDDFKEVPKEIDPRFTIAHIGNAGAQRNPKILFATLSVLAERNPEFRKDLRLRFVGNIDRVIHEELHRAGLKGQADIIPYVPHRKAIEYMVNASVLLLVINQTVQNQGILTGKLYDYIGARRPILAIGPPGGDVDQILKDSGTGILVDYDDKETTHEIVLKYYHRWKERRLNVETVHQEQFSRRTQAKNLSQIFDSLVNGAARA